MTPDYNPQQAGWASAWMICATTFRDVKPHSQTAWHVILFL